MEKLNIVDTVDFWIEARLLRNKIAHTYMPEKLKDFCKRLMRFLKDLRRYSGL